MYYKATVIKKMGHWLKDRETEQWNRIASPEKTCLIYDKDGSAGTFQYMGLGPLKVHMGKNNS